jgi:hypothetical protein
MKKRQRITQHPKPPSNLPFDRCFPTDINRYILHILRWRMIKILDSPYASLAFSDVSPSHASIKINKKTFSYLWRWFHTDRSNVSDMDDDDAPTTEDEEEDHKDNDEGEDEDDREGQDPYQLLSYYKPTLRCRRTWIPLFLHCLDTCVLNSYIISKQKDVVSSHKRFVMDWVNTVKMRADTHDRQATRRALAVLLSPPRSRARQKGFECPTKVQSFLNIDCREIRSPIYWYLRKNREGVPTAITKMQ